MNYDIREKLRDFIIKTNGTLDSEIDFDLLVAEFGEREVLEFLERGWIYEPVLGKARYI
jgi:hypothetical protein